MGAAALVKWKMIMKKFLFPLSYGLILLLAGCSDQPVTEAKKAETPAEPVTGQSALFRMYQVARLWASDVNVLKMNSIHLTEVPAVRGKAGAWQATFVSAEKSVTRSYTYSVIEGEGNLHQGVFPGPQEPWSGPATKTFLISAVKIDTEAAYKAALEPAADYDKKNPKLTISFDLEMHENFPNPSWRVIWGESAGTSANSVLVDAFTGKYLETLH
jgi:hypothetical protein